MVVGPGDGGARFLMRSPAGWARHLSCLLGKGATKDEVTMGRILLGVVIGVILVIFVLGSCVSVIF